MTEAVQFHTDLYRRDALEAVVKKYLSKAHIELADVGPHVVARVDMTAEDESAQALRDEFCTEVFSATARKLRDLANGTPGDSEAAPVSDAPPWALLAPFGAGTSLGLDWTLESLTPIRSGAATMSLRHPQHGVARVTIRRNAGAPLGVASTEHLDFMLMNGGSGTGQTEPTIAKVLMVLAAALREVGKAGRSSDPLLAALQPHSENRAARNTGARDAAAAGAAGSRRIAPAIDLDESTISFEIDETGVSRLAIYDAMLAFAERCHIMLTRPDAGRIGVCLKAKGESSTDDLRALTRDVVKSLNQVTRPAAAASAAAGNGGLPVLQRRQINVEALLDELAAADAATLGLNFQPERGPGHENLRIMNILGTGACDSDCLFCCEKFNPGNRLMPNADATRQLILDGSGQFDMLFFASGEPTIHPKLFEYVELAREVGFTAFGMSSHFRTFADPRFALKTLQAGFEYFDISLHAADRASQLDVNPIGDSGESLFEALKGLANIFRLADALGVRVSVTHKIVVSRLNVTRLEEIFRATYDRGVRHFILQPVRSLGLAKDRQTALAISEDEILPYLNEFLRRTEGLDAAIKPYGFSRQALVTGPHVEHEQNRVKNVMGKHKRPRGSLHLPANQEARPADGRFWVEVRTPYDQRFAFAADGRAPVLDEALQRGAQLPFGCRMGSCGMCCARLLEGRVDQSSQVFLTPEQQEQGFVLLCQARPRSDVTVVMCTDDEIDPL